MQIDLLELIKIQIIEHNVKIIERGRNQRFLQFVTRTGLLALTLHIFRGPMPMFEAFQSSYVTLKVDSKVSILTCDVELDQLQVVAILRIQDRIMHNKLLHGILLNLVFAKELFRIQYSLCGFWSLFPQ